MSDVLDPDFRREVDAVKRLLIEGQIAFSSDDSRLKMLHNQLTDDVAKAKDMTPSDQALFKDRAIDLAQALGLEIAHRLAPLSDVETRVVFNHAQARRRADLQNIEYEWRRAPTARPKVLSPESSQTINEAIDGINQLRSRIDLLAPLDPSDVDATDVDSALGDARQELKGFYQSNGLGPLTGTFPTRQTKRNYALNDLGTALESAAHRLKDDEAAKPQLDTAKRGLVDARRRVMELNEAPVAQVENELDVRILALEGLAQDLTPGRSLGGNSATIA